MAKLFRTCSLSGPVVCCLRTVRLGTVRFSRASVGALNVSKIGAIGMVLPALWFSAGMAEAKGLKQFAPEVSALGTPMEVASADAVHQAVNRPDALPSSGLMEQVNQQFASTVVIPTYEALSDRTADLAQAAQVFDESPNPDTLATVRAAWVEAVAAWSAGSAFAFGPVHSLGYSTALEFPTDEEALNQLLTDATLFDSTTEVKHLLPSLQGFEAMSYLLFGAEQAKTLDDFSDQERMYLSKLAIASHQTANELLDVWQTGWNGYSPYGSVLATAGQSGNAMYLAPEAGTEEIIRGIVNNLDVVVNEVMPELLEGPEALSAPGGAVDLQLLQANIRGTHLAYMGSTEATTKADAEAIPGLAQWVATANPQVALQIQASLGTALTQLEQGRLSLQGESGIDVDVLTEVNDALTTAYELMDGPVLSLVTP